MRVATLASAPPQLRPDLAVSSTPVLSGTLAPTLPLWIGRY